MLGEPIKVKDPLRFYILLSNDLTKKEVILITMGTNDPETALKEFNRLVIDGEPLHPNYHPNDPVRYNNYRIAMLLQTVKRVDRFEKKE